MVDFVVGSVVRDEDFWFREYFIDDLWDSLRKHNVLMLAPRRTGKTSVMYHLLDNPRDGWLIIHLNVEDIESPAEFIIHLIGALQEHQPDFLRNTLSRTCDFLQRIFDRVQSVEALDLKLELRKSEDLIGKGRWQPLADQLLERVMAADIKILFIVDEFPDMLNNIASSDPENYELFLHWFRKLRDRTLANKVRWLLGGSVNLIAHLNYHGKVNLVNDLKVETLPLFTETEVDDFVTKMLQERAVPFEADIIPSIRGLLGSPIPIFLQMFTQELYRHWRRQRLLTISVSAVHEVFNKVLLGEMARDKFLHYRSRIALHYPVEQREAAILLLDRLAASEFGLRKEDLLLLYRQAKDRSSASPLAPLPLHQSFDCLMMDLQGDFYVSANSDGRFDFTNLLLKAWWRKYYG